MYQDTIDQFAQAAKVKSEAMRANPAGFLVAAAMAGAYVGIGIVLILTIGQTVPPALRPLVMGVSFGIALTLVVFAGSELFTGHTMMMTLGVLKRSIGLGSLARSWVMTWVGNFAGSVLLGSLFVLAGGGHILKEGADLVFAIAAAKMNAPALELLVRGVLCNWLVCLALWTSARTTNDVAKCILIFWCLFAFIASGFEHSIANMTVFTIALLGDHPATVSLAGMGYNLLWVTLGNTLAGVMFVAAGYWQASTGFSLFAGKKRESVPTAAE